VNKDYHCREVFINRKKRYPPHTHTHTHRPRTETSNDDMRCSMKRQISTQADISI